MAEVTLSRNEYSSVPGPKPALSDWAEVIKEEEARGASLFGPIVLGCLTLFFGVGGFFLWAMTTELSSAAMASGRIVVESNTKTVSHLEGGTLKELLVKEGQRVKAGDIMATLDVTRNESSLSQLKQQMFSYQAQLARLVAERDEKKVYDYHDEPPNGMDPTSATNVLETEKRLFKERTNLFRDQLAADQSGIDQLASQRVAIDARLQSTLLQAEVVQREFDTYSKLQARKLITMAMLNDKKLQLVELDSRIAENKAALSENNQKKTQLELAMTGRRNDYFRGVSVEIQQTQNSIAGVRQQIVAAGDLVTKAAIRSPQDGVVANIKVRTPGSAVLGGQPVLDIVPDNQPMLVEGSARSMDIDQIRIGQKAEIKLSAFGAAELLPLIGQITYIAPDSVADPRTGEMMFAFKAKIDDAELKKQPNLFLYPGMSAEVFIINADRTALAYLGDPIRKSFQKAFREQ
ncbi:HlyD family type I secretion periplasmic adaptor subunit [Rhizobium sp.]